MTPALLIAASLAAAPPAAPAAPADPAAGAKRAAVPVVTEGYCRASGLGQSYLRDHETENGPAIRCDRVVAIGDAALAFFDGDGPTPQLMLSGRAQSTRIFRVELVRLADGPLRTASAGQCHDLSSFLWCWAVFADGGVRRGVAVTFVRAR